MQHHTTYALSGSHHGGDALKHGRDYPLLPLHLFQSNSLASGTP